MNAIPPSLVDFGLQLERAIEHDLATPRRRGVLIRAAVAAATVAVAGVAALGAFDAVGTKAPSAVERAAAALALEGGAILHVAIVGSQDNGDGTTARWRSESWQATSPPYARRQVEQVGGEAAVETASTDAGATTLVYDPSTRTIYERREAEPAAPATKPMRWRDAKGNVHRFVEKRGARPAHPVPQPSHVAEPFRQELLALLESGEAKEDGTTTLHGRAATRIVAADGHATYFVDAKTFDPIEFRTKGLTGGTVIRFVAYEQLQFDDRTSGLLSLHAQHPSARSSTDPVAFEQAQARLFPRG